jgi:hypothetical protein
MEYNKIPTGHLFSANDHMSVGDWLRKLNEDRDTVYGWPDWWMGSDQQIRPSL